MRDFLNFDFLSKPLGKGRVLHTMKHKERDGVVVEFETPSGLSAEGLGALVKKNLKAYATKYMEKSRQPLTGKQKAFYDKLVEFHKMEGRPPSYDEQCVIMGVSSKGTPYHYVKKLVEKGWIWIDERGLVIPVDIATQDVE